VRCAIGVCCMHARSSTVRVHQLGLGLVLFPIRFSCTCSVCVLTDRRTDIQVACVSVEHDVAKWKLLGSNGVAAQFKLTSVH
jgi:hypothetical protein